MTHHTLASRVLREARAAFGHQPDATDVTVLCCRISQLERYRDERLSVLNLNAAQAQMIAQRDRKIKRLHALLISR
jgi:hypothetical protein